MSLTLTDAGAVPAQPWRNGGGQTRELLAWPAGDAWQVRVSRADIDRDGPFSAFPQVQRWFAVLQGPGVVLAFDKHATTLRAADDAVCFDGASAPDCRLLDGPTQDLNLMVRQGRGTLHRCLDGVASSSAWTMRGLYTTRAGRWSGDTRTLDVPAHTLLWSTRASDGPWSFQAHRNDPAGGAWWLGFTPRA